MAESIKRAIYDIKNLKNNLPNNFSFIQEVNNDFTFRLKYNNIIFEIKTHMQYPDYPPIIKIIDSPYKIENNFLIYELD